MKTSYFRLLFVPGVLAVVAHADPDRGDHGDGHSHGGGAPAPHVSPQGPGRGSERRELPRGRVDVRVGNQHFYEHRGTFYRPGPHGYVVVRPPRGAFIPRLPPFAARIYIGGSLFYRYDNIYYEGTPEGYVVVDPPTDQTVMVAPGPGDAVTAPAQVAPPAPNVDYQSIYVGSVQYFFRDGQFFQRTNDGMVWTPAPIGAITPSLPPDAASVWYQEIEYFDCDGVYFRKTPDGYKVVNAPWNKN